MKARYGAVILLAWIVFWAAGVSASDVPPAPEIEIAQPSYTFSAVVDGESVVHDFIVRNRGRADLEIYKVHTG